MHEKVEHICASCTMKYMQVKGGIYMLVSVLTDMISEAIPCRITKEADDRNLQRFCFLQDNLSLMDESCLYIGEQNDAVNHDGAAVVLTTESSDWSGLEKGRIIIRVPKAHFFECLNLVTKAFFHEQERAEQFNRLLSGPAEQTPFHEIIDNAAVFLGRSLVLTDMSFHVVDYSTSVAITDPIWKTNVKRGFSSYEFIEAMNILIPDNSLPTNSDPFFVNCDASRENKLCSIVFFNQRPIGYLVLLDNERGILPYHLQYLPKIGQLLILSLKHMPNFQSLFINAAENIFLNLLEGKSEDIDHLRIINASITLPKCMRCLLFIPKNSSKHDRYYMQRNLYSLFPNSSVFLYQNDVIAIVSDKDSHKLADPSLCGEQMKNVKEVGVSSVFRTPEEFPYFLQCAKTACEMAHRLGQKEIIHYYDRYQFFHILSTCHDQTLLRSYIHPAFDMLQEYDAANDTALLKTLQTYIDHGLNAKETAVELYLHRNTLTYRLNKIRELTDIDFENLETVFRLSCSFRINELMGIYDIQ